MTETIGNRAVIAIKDRANKNGISLHQEAKKIGIDARSTTLWSQNGNPSAYYLQQMALAGYDVIWILTGKESNNVKD